MSGPQLSRRALIGSAVGAVAGGTALLALISRVGGGAGGASDLADKVIDLRPTTPASVDRLAFLTPQTEFFRIDTVGKMYPRVVSNEWTLRIHGMVDREVNLTLADIDGMTQVEHVVTLGCVSNKVGGDLIGTARWGGVYLADVLALAGVDPAAEQLVSRSVDGWTCGTPVSAVLDGRAAMLVTRMNGELLTGEHGFPVRMIVPGLFGFVSATKWLADINVTMWDAFDPYWLERGWARESPMLASSRIDVPRTNSRHAAGVVTFGGFAWAPRTGVGLVQLRVDGGEWSTMSIVERDSGDAWVLWKGEIDLTAGDHRVEVRVVDVDGVPQVETERDVLPSGATGLHRVVITVEES